VQEGRERFLKRAAVTSVIAVPLLWFVLAPFPGLGLIYSITDPLRGHPHSKHGTQPSEYVGLWVKENPVEFGFISNAISLLADGHIGQQTGTSRLSWHFDDSLFSLDRVSGCGNCYRGVLTSDFKVEFDGKDRIKLTPVESYSLRDIEGWYQRMDMTQDLRDRMTEQAKHDDDAISAQARAILRAFEYGNSPAMQ
jgi:hypothetical protein